MGNHEFNAIAWLTPDPEPGASRGISEAAYGGELPREHSPRLRARKRTVPVSVEADDKCIETDSSVDNRLRRIPVRGSPYTCSRRRSAFSILDVRFPLHPRGAEMDSISLHRRPAILDP
jgi:hypothetical protein